MNINRIQPINDFNTNSLFKGTFLKNHTINFDTRSRSNIKDSSTDFIIELPTEINNIICARLITFELPNIEYTFSNTNGNVSFTLS